MTKEELIKENKRLQDRNIALEEKTKEMEQKLDNYSRLKQLNIDLQVELQHEKYMNNNNNSTIQMLMKQVETYEEVFELLKGRKE